MGAPLEFALRCNTRRPNVAVVGYPILLEQGLTCDRASRSSCSWDRQLHARTVPDAILDQEYSSGG